MRVLLAGLSLIMLPLTGWAEDAAAFSRALSSAQAGDWATADDAAAQSGPVAQSVAQWLRLRAGQGGLEDYRRWLADHPGWPDRARIAAQAERKAAAASPAEARKWFADFAPQTLAGREADLAARVALADPGAAVALGHLWREQELSAADEDRLLAQYDAELAPHHAGRLERALDEGRLKEATRMLPRVIPAQAALARARIALQARSPGVDDMIRALPEGLRDHEGLTRDRFRWRLRAGLLEGAEELLLNADAHPEGAGDPAFWADGRLRLVREAMQANDWARARRLAEKHRLSAGGDFADLEWLAGYAAYRQGDYAAAAAHFTTLRLGVGSPISLSRAGYWEGRAYEAAGDSQAAYLAYSYAAQYATAYYGQLAAERAGLPMPDTLTGLVPLPDWRGHAINEDPLWQAAIWLWTAGDQQAARRFLIQLAREGDAAFLPPLARFVSELYDPYLALTVGKIAALRGVLLPAVYYPLSGLEQRELPAPPELVLSIARRESEFRPDAKSHAGALGLMQVMPETGRMMATELGLEFDVGQMTDPDYNARLGAAYLAHLEGRFGPSLAMIAAGYNAGPGRPAQWAERFGDPRDAQTDVVDWVEAIPFSETRNYVMRVAEAWPMYRARLAGGPVEWGIEAALRGQPVSAVSPSVSPEPGLGSM